MDDKMKAQVNVWVTERLNDSCARLRKSKKYRKLRLQKEKSDIDAEELLLKLNEKERLIVQKHYEAVVALSFAETKEAYAQGWRDGIAMMVEVFTGGEE